MQEGNFLAPCYTRVQNGAATCFWSEHRVGLWAKAREEGRDIDYSGHTLPDFRPLSLRDYNNQNYSPEKEQASIRRINRSASREWIPMEIEKALKQQEADESRVRIAREKEKWLTDAKL